MKSLKSLFRKAPILIVFALVVVGVVALYNLCSGGVIDTTSIGNSIMATTPLIVDTPTEEAARSNVSTWDLDAVSKKVTEISPSRTPLDTLLRAVPTLKANSFKVRYYKVDMRGFYTQMTSAYTAPTSPKVSHDNIPVDKPGIFGVNDTIVVPEVTGANTTDGKPLVLFVTAVNATTLTVYPLNTAAIGGGDDSPAMIDIPNDAYMRRMGNAMNELDMQTDIITSLPASDYNYNQIFMSQVEEGTFQAINDKEVEWGFTDFERANLLDMKLKIEMSFLNGFRSEFSHPTTGKNHYTTGGILRAGLTQYDTLAVNSITKEDYSTWMEGIFTGNGGSETRYLLAGKKLMYYLQLVDEVQKQVSGDSTEVKFGIRFKKIENDFGTLLVKYNYVMDMAGYERYGLVLDMNNIEKYGNMPLKTQELDLEASGQRRSKAKVLTESSCVAVRYPETHGIVYVKES